MSEKIISLNTLKEYDEQLQEAYIKPLEKNIKELENAIIGGGGSSSVGIQSDWNQTDETAIDFIKNKPFGKKHVYKELANGEYTSEPYDDLMGLYGAQVWFSEDIEDIQDTVFDVTLDGVEYKGLTPVYIEAMDAYCIGNLGYLAAFGLSYENTGEPFIASLGLSGCLLATDVTQSTTCSFAISTFVDEVIKLDNKYFSVKDDEDYIMLIEDLFSGDGRAVNRAKSDANGEVIDQTYVTKSELETTEKELNNKITIAQNSVDKINDDLAAMSSLIDDNMNTLQEELANVKHEIIGDVIVVTFDCQLREEGKYDDRFISLQNISATSIDWGDGSINTDLTHNYDDFGEYICKIYGVTSIGNYAFYKCRRSVRSVVIGDSVTSIGERAFRECYDLASAVIGKNVEVIGNGAFSGGDFITIEIPSSVTSIGEGAFANCDELTGIVIPDGVSSIEARVFMGCRSLTSLVIGDSVTSIGERAFSSCNSLTSVVIPDSVTSIGEDAFAYCNTLKSVIFKSNVPIQYTEDIFAKCDSLTSISVPYGRKQAYIDAWRNDGAPQEILDLIVESDREAMMSDLTDYVKNTDYATADKAGVVMANYTNGIGVTDGHLFIYGAENSNIDDRRTNRAITPRNLDYAVKVGITTNTETLTDAEKASTCEWIGALQKWTPAPDGATTLLGLLANGTYTTYKLTFGVPRNNYIPCYVARGASNNVLGTGTPVNPTDCANKDYVDNLPDYLTLTDEQKAKWQEMVGTGSSSEAAPAMVYTTYTELKELRDNAQLVPGQFYRITDYECTTSQENTRAMNHQFDIIVQALSANTLSENAKADYHEGDNYFLKTLERVISDSNIISEQVETPIEKGQVEWLYRVYEDGPGFDYNGTEEFHSVSDEFVAFSFLKDNNGIMVPVLYKTDLGKVNEETGESSYSREDVDYEEPYYYVGEQYIDGVVYDKWRKIENSGPDNFQWDSAAKQYALTNKIVGPGLLIDATFTYDDPGKIKIASLNAWELKYCLDNDTSRFAWADTNVPVATICVEGIFGDSEWWTRAESLEYDGVTYYLWANQNYSEGDHRSFYISKTENPVFGDDLGSITYYEGDSIDEIVPGGDGTVIGAENGNGPSRGKGVIYYMKDEWNNECPYDFKNIQFKRYMITEVSEALAESTLMGSYLGLPQGQDYSIDESDYIWCYTFSWLNEHNVVEDLSTVGHYLKNDEGQYSGVYDNIIKCVSNCNMTYEESPESFKIDLNDIVFLSIYSPDESFYGCYSNTFGNDCSRNTFGNDCYYITFGNCCHNNTFCNNCNYITFGNNCYNNTFGSECPENAFGNNCNHNIFGNDCNHNIFGNSCYDNIFDNGCYSNAFGNSCINITFGNYCNNNTFGNNCNYIIFGNNCYNNTFGSDCDSILIQEDYVAYVNITEGCYYIKFVNDESPSYNNLIQNITIEQGIHGDISKDRLQLHVSRNTAPVIFRAKNTTEIILD